jgi:hypothetical protein
MSQERYRIEDHDDVQHCVYHAIMDAKLENQNRRIATLIAELTAVLVQKGCLTNDQLDEVLAMLPG